MGLPTPKAAPATPPAPAASVAPADRAVFAQSFETLLKACGDPPRLEILAAFRESGIDMQKPLQVAYPLAVHLSVLTKIRKLLHPGLPDDEALYLIGRAFIARYSTTMIGRALLKMFSVLGPRRLLGRLTQSFRTATNYVEAFSEERGMRHYVVRIRPVNNPHFYRGLITAALEVAGAKGLEVKPLGYAAEEVTLDIRWNE